MLYKVLRLSKIFWVSKPFPNAAMQILKFLIVEAVLCQIGNDVPDSLICFFGDLNLVPI